jgi:GMP synthase PP-ATPase subunit
LSPRVATRIIDEVRGIKRVDDVTSKPSGTIACE